MDRTIRKEDYLEPDCPFCSPAQEKMRPVDLRRFFEKLDEHLGRNDLAAARRHLDYWAAEAESQGDLRGLLTIENERMGLLRKLGDEPAAMQAVRAAEELLGRTGLAGSVTGATTLLNIGTVYKRFDRAAQALPCYEQAREIYERLLEPDDPRRGGLYNNEALALTDLGRYAEARELYEKALAIMEKAEHGKLEMAITELNLANLAEAEQGLLEAEAEIEARLDRAERYLDDPSLVHDGYYAFVCDKCAPTFGYYGRFCTAQALKERAEELYERA